MNCQDVAKLRTPLDAVCQTTDIGCVPIVSGKPTCKPQPDELPIAYDKTTATLWLFSCDTREWVAHKKFTMDELQDLNLENLNNICSILKIGVFYNPGTGTIQGNVSLGEFAEQLLKCLDLETKVITVTQGENNTIKISIEGLDGLPPTYVKGDNVWFTGTGTEGDPVVVHTYDPICKWPVASQSTVDAATTKHLGACLDGQPSRVPYPPKPCEYPQKTQEEVDAAASKNLIACVDGEAAKVPYPKFQPPVCESDQITLEQAKEKGSSLTIVGCDNGDTVRIPVSQSGFFDRDYICVPTVIGAPQDAPMEGTGPLRIGCNGELYVWICNSEGSGRWEEVRYNMNSLSTLDPDNVSDLCNNFRMMGWYSNTSGDPCVEQVKLTLEDLTKMIADCAAMKGCSAPFVIQQYVCTGRWNGDRSIGFKNVNLVPLAPEYDHNNGLKIAIYQSHSFTWLKGSGDVGPQIESPQNNGLGETHIELVNNTDCQVTYDIETYASVFRNAGGMNRNIKFSVGCVAGVSEYTLANLNSQIFLIGQGVGNITSAQVAVDSDSILASSFNIPNPRYQGKQNHHIPGNTVNYPTLNPYSITMMESAKSMQNKQLILNPGEKKDLYLAFWVFIVGPYSRIENVAMGAYATAIVRAYRGIRI